MDANRINYVLVIKMESAIIESDKRLSTERVTKFKISKETVTNCKYRRKRCQNFMWRQTGNPIIINNKDRKRGQHHEKDS